MHLQVLSEMDCIIPNITVLVCSLLNPVSFVFRLCLKDKYINITRAKKAVLLIYLRYMAYTLMGGTDVEHIHFHFSAMTDVHTSDTCLRMVRTRHTRSLRG
jgi:hypothetical protein